MNGYLPSTGPVPGNFSRPGVSLPEAATTRRNTDGESAFVPSNRPPVSPAGSSSFDPADRSAPVSPGGQSAVTAQIIAQQQSGGNAAPGQVSESSSDSFALSDEERAIVQRMKARDREVRAHEAAHAAAGGSYASAPHFEFEQGPDGIQYAVSGHVTIDTAPVSGDPEATIDKMETVRRAALAPATPSGQDRAVAQAAEAAARAASAELAAQRADEASAPESDEETDSPDVSVQAEFAPDSASIPTAIQAYTQGSLLAAAG